MEYWVREEFEHETLRDLCKVAKFTVGYWHGPYCGPLTPDTKHVILPVKPR